MQVPLEISYRNVPKTESLESLIREKASGLEKVAGHVTSCRVAVESPHRHQESGRAFRVRIEVRVPPGRELVVRKESSRGELHDALPVVVRGAFDAVRRQLREQVERQRGETKDHPRQEASAVVEKLFSGEGYGFLRTLDGREVYFHRNSVLHGDFDRLETGTGVRFVEEAGEKGPQASTVQIVDKPDAG